LSIAEQSLLCHAAAGDDVIRGSAAIRLLFVRWLDRADGAIVGDPSQEAVLLGGNRGAVESAVRVGQPLGIAVLEANSSYAANLSSCSTQGSWVWVRANELCRGVSPLGTRDEITRAAINFQDAPPVCKFRVPY
jgi:hypothetical protein